MFPKRESFQIPQDAENEVDPLSRLEEPIEPRVADGFDGQPRQADWSGLVARIQSADVLAMEELYQIFSRGIRFHLCRRLGPQELDDKVHDTFLIVVQAIQRGELREPDRLMGFVRTIVRRQIAAYIDELIQNRKESAGEDVDERIPDSRRNPEQNIAFRQKNRAHEEHPAGSGGSRSRDLDPFLYL